MTEEVADAVEEEAKVVEKEPVGEDAQVVDELPLIKVSAQ